jgi:cytochrome P450
MTAVRSPFSIFNSQFSIPRPPGPRSIIPGLQLRAMQRDALAFLRGVAREHGDISHFTFGPQHVYLVNHPELIHDVLVKYGRSFQKGRALQRTKIILGEGLLTSEGELHKRQRRLAQPAFHRERIARYAEVMIDRAVRMGGRWRDGQELDIHHEMMRVTLSVVAKTLFNADVDEEADEIGASLTALMEMFPILVTPFGEYLRLLPLPRTRRFEAALKRLDQTIFSIIEERRRSGRDEGDLLSMLLLAQDEEEGGGGMTDRQVRDEAMTLFLAGHETTANALSWTWWVLSQNPEAEGEMHEELDRVLGGRTPAPADYPKLPFTEMVLAESMRLFPPAWGMGRLAIEDVQLGEWTVPKGAVVIVAPAITQQDARWWPDPQRFDPRRFTPEAKAARPRMTYFPFGAGTRICIGESFAWMEGVLILATLARHWRVRVLEEPRPQASITLRPRGGMRARLERHVSS